MVVTSSSALFITLFLNSYRKWKAMGPGGLPYSMKGYLLNLYVTLSMAYSDTKTIAVYERPGDFSSQWLQASEAERSESQKVFLKTPLQHRVGPPTRALPFAIPQREKNADVDVDAELRRKYLAAFDELQHTNSETTEWKTSLLEKRGKALFLKSNLPLRCLAAPSHREICHIHSSDMSAHVTLSLADAREVITKGFGERHRLSGTKLLPLGYTMLYVPRSSDEVDVLVNILQAGIDYMRSG